MTGKMANQTLWKMESKRETRRRLGLRTGMAVALLACAWGNAWAKMPVAAYQNYFIKLGLQRLEVALPHVSKVELAGHIVSVDPALTAWSHLETVVNSHRLLTDQLPLLTQPGCRLCPCGMNESAEVARVSAGEVSGASESSKVDNYSDKGWHLLADTSYRSTNFKSWTDLKVRGPIFLVGGYQVKHDTLYGYVVSGASQKYDAWDSTFSYLGQCGRSTVLSGGIFAKWRPNAFWLASSVQLGVSRFTNSIYRGYVDPLTHLVGSFYCGTGVDCALTKQFGADFYTSYQYTYVGREGDDEGALQKINSQLVRVGGRLRYDFNGYGNSNGGTTEQAWSLAYLGAAYDCELGAKLIVEDAKKQLSPHSAVIETGYDLRFKRLGAKVSASTSLAKIKRRRLALSLSYEL